MEISTQLIESLMFEEESNTLDFKRDQYKFIDSTVNQKSELLKDIVSFANGWRRTDAFILIGVKEIKAEKNELFGINEKLDDSQLQQFVNSKIQKPVTFIYKNIKYENTEIGIIHIPVQNRPFYLTKDYGKLKRNTVYIRRGTSTDEASPDEILTMKNDGHNEVSDLPNLKISIITKPKNIKTIVEVDPYEIMDQEDVIGKLSKLVIKKEMLKLVDHHKKKLDSIQDRYPDGNEFYPFKVQIVHDFNTKLKKSLELAKQDFVKFCKHADLFHRSFEFKKSPKADFRKRDNKYPFYALLNLDNSGTAPAEGMIVYLEDSESVKFYNWEGIKEVNVKPYVELPDHIEKIINKAKDLENGVYTHIMTMYERVTGSKWNHFNSQLSDLSHFGGNIFKPFMAKRLDGKVQIIIKEELLHNHELSFSAEDIFLCPMVEEGEIGKFEYEVHAKNLPKPIRGIAQIKGKRI